MIIKTVVDAANCYTLSTRFPIGKRCEHVLAMAMR